MPTYYAELTGGTIKATETFSGGTIYSTGGATVIQNIKSASATPSSSSQHISITPDVGYDAMGEVQLTVDAIPPEYIIPTGTKTITTNGTHDVKDYQNAYVNVQGGGGATLETKSVSYTPSESAISDTLLPDVGYDGFSEVDVSVDAIPSNYVGSSVPRKSSTDLTSSGATVTAPAGYYENAASKAIPNASQALTDAYVQSSGDLEVELNTSSGGYVSNGNQYLQFENFTTPVPTTTYYATSSDQVIMSQNSMAFGAQTIKGVTTTNLLASNIKKDVVVEVGDSADPDRIVSVTGTYEGGGGGGGNAYSGTITPASDTETLTIDVPALCSFAAVFFDGTWANFTVATSGRTTMFVSGNATDYYVEDCNNSKGGISRADRQPSWRGDGVVFSATQITVKCLGNGVITKFPAGQTYRWFAS